MKTSKIINFIAVLTIVFVSFFAASVAFASSVPKIEIMGAGSVTDYSAVFQTYFFEEDAELGAERPVVQFEYGTNASNLNESTPAIRPRLGGKNVVIENMRNLEEDTTYYYRAVMFVDGDKYETDITSFKTKSRVANTNTSSSTATNSTSSNTNNGSVVSVSTNNTSGSVSANTSSNGSASTAGTQNDSGTQTSGNTNSSSLNAKTYTDVLSDDLLITIENDVDEIAKNDIVTYNVFIKNTSNRKLENTIITITLPEEMVITDVAGSQVVENKGEVIADLGTMYVNEEEIITITGRLRTNSSDDKVVARAEGVFDTETGNNQDETIVYDVDDYTGQVLKGAGLTASAAGAGFFPTNIFGWMLLMVMVLAIFLIARHYTRKPKEDIEPEFYQDGNGTVHMASGYVAQ
jgi:hypothetical protein